MFMVFVRLYLWYVCGCICRMFAITCVDFVCVYNCGMFGGYPCFSVVIVLVYWWLYIYILYFRGCNML